MINFIHFKRTTFVPRPLHIISSMFFNFYYQIVITQTFYRFTTNGLRKTNLKIFIVFFLIESIFSFLFFCYDKIFKLTFIDLIFNIDFLDMHFKIYPIN